MSWSRAFHVPITTPNGLMLRTLRDAGEYIRALPRAKHKQPEWQIAAEMLLEAVEGSGPADVRRDCHPQSSERLSRLLNRHRAARRRRNEKRGTAKPRALCARYALDAQVGRPRYSRRDAPADRREISGSNDGGRQDT